MPPFDGSEIMRTGTQTDVGRWFRQGYVSAQLRSRELRLFADGPTPYEEIISLSQLGESLYNHVTGEVVLAPAPEARVTRLRLPPVEGLNLLEQMTKKRGV